MRLGIIGYRYMILFNAALAGLNLGLWTQGFGRLPLFVGLLSVFAVTFSFATVQHMEREVLLRERRGIE